MLGIGVKRNFVIHAILLSQKAYIDNLIENSGLNDTRPFTTPLGPGQSSQRPVPQHAWKIDSKAENRSCDIIGLLQYVSLAIRPDVAFAVSKYSQFLANPGYAHFRTATPALRYPNRTKEWPLNLGYETDIAGFSNSDLVGDRDNHKSTGAYVFRMGGGIVSSKTQKQTSAALSSVETEYMAHQVPFYRLRKPVRCSLAISESKLALEQCSSPLTLAT